MISDLNPEVVEVKEAFWHEGFLIDSTTGEILEVSTEGSPDKPFTVSDRSSAEWVLDKMSETEAWMAAINLRREAMLANMEIQTNAAKRRLDFLKFKFTSELEEFARKELEGKREKTLTLDNGKLSFRTQPAGCAVTIKPGLEAKAMEWACKYCPEAVVIPEPKLSISELKKNPYLDDDIFERSETKETFTVRTGVSIK